MLSIYKVTLDVCIELRPVLAALDKSEPDLARQLRRALASIALNLAEGSGSQGWNQTSRYFNALGSAKESLAALEVAAALDRISPVDPTVLSRFDRIIGTLVRLLH